jgi:hypothetical protein
MLVRHAHVLWRFVSRSHCLEAAQPSLEERDSIPNSRIQQWHVHRGVTSYPRVTEPSAGAPLCQSFTHFDGQTKYSSVALHSRYYQHDVGIVYVRQEYPLEAKSLDAG